MNRMARTLTGIMAFTAVIFTAGCEAATAPDAQLAEAYDATEFLLRTDTGAADLLDEGSILSVFLHSNSSLTGYLFVPGGRPDGADLDEDLQGGWSVSGDEVTLTTNSNTFLSNVTFIVQNEQLIYQDQFVFVALSPANPG